MRSTPPAPPEPTALRPSRAAIQFNRHEAAGCVGDLGTDLPLLAAMIVAAQLNVASVLVVFGGLQIITGLVYRMPMPVQPLKAMAALVIAQKADAATLYGGGLAIGLLVLLLTLTGSLSWLARAIPPAVVRGVQFGLGLQLATLAGRDFIGPAGWLGWGLAALAFGIVVLLWGHPRWPAALIVIGLGLVFAAFFDLDWQALHAGAGFALPTLQVPTGSDIWLGLLVLALPQLPLSLGNSILATERLAADLFPARAPGVRKLGFTYAGMNLVAPFFGGVPVCHGSGGMAGHYAFGGRTGGSVVMYGAFFVAVGLFVSGSFEQVVRFFPRAILGVLLFFEGLALLRRVRDAGLAGDEWLVTFIVGLCAVSLPYGYLVGLLLGWLVHRLIKRRTISGEL